MSLLVLRPAMVHEQSGVLVYTCPFCATIRTCSIQSKIFAHTCAENGGPVFFFNGYALKNAHLYMHEVRQEIERRKNGPQ